ncbi:MAG: potassium channel family protein [Bacteroidota bacterium]
MKKWYAIDTEDNNYLYFLLSLVLMLVLPALVSKSYVGIIILDIVYALVLIMSVIYAGTKRLDFIILGIIASIIFILFLYEQQNIYFSIVSAGATLLFFSIVLVKVVKYILTNPIGANEIYACATGYMILGILGASLFFVVEKSVDNAFNLPEQGDFYTFVYFSFITLTSVGYGDISPVHSFAKSSSILLSITGQLYLTILIAIIVGKFIAGDKER